MQSGKTVTGGVVLRVTDTKETDRILTVLTADRGKIPLIARGARRKNSRLAAACPDAGLFRADHFQAGQLVYAG